MLRFVSVALALAFVRMPRVSRWISCIGSATASALTGGLALAVLTSHSPIAGILWTQYASGFALSYRIDALSAWFLLVLATVSIPIVFYNVGYLGHGALGGRSPFIAAGLNILIGAVEWVFVAGDVISFLFGWELMTLVNVALVVSEHEHQQTRRAGYLYLVMSHVGTGFLIAGFLLLASTAHSLEFAHVLNSAPPAHLRDLLFVMFFLGFGTKAGIVPLHIWLPEAHPAAPSSISALMSGVLIKTGIYGIFRVCAFGLGPPRFGWGLIILALGALSAILGVLYALMQHDLKRLLAYHSIENIGIILLGLGSGMLAISIGHPEIAPIGLVGSLYHVLNHAVFKVLLFLGAGGVVTATGTRDIEQMGGLIKRMPWTAVLFLTGAAAISGLPLLNGFVSEWFVFQSFLIGFQGVSTSVMRLALPVGAAILALTSALAAACFVKAFGITFLALPRSDRASAAKESPRGMLWPQAFLAILCILLGLFPAVVVGALQSVVATLPGVASASPLVARGLSIAIAPGQFDELMPGLLAAAVLMGLTITGFVFMRTSRPIRLAPTWACGGELTAQNEYTATAFSKPLLMIFSAVYRPTREVATVAPISPYFPREVHYRAHIEPTFERFLYNPLTRTIVTFARQMRVIQAGSLHAYLAYVLTLIVTLVLVLWWGG